MTKPRVFGSDVPFMDWLRNHPQLESKCEGISATDTDAVIHQYSTAVVDAQGRRERRTRQVQALMGIEVKTRNGVVHPAQLDTLWKWHLTRRSTYDKLPGWSIRNFGWSFIRLSGTRPDNSDSIDWGRFNSEGTILWKPINVATLITLLSFQCHPDNFEKQTFRRHHKTENVWRFEVTPLGLTVPVLEVRRS